MKYIVVQNLSILVELDNVDGTWTFTLNLHENQSIIFTYDVADDSMNAAIYVIVGDHTLPSGIGDDLLVGGKGTDILTGGGGVDTFKFVTNDQNTTVEFFTDTIANFEVGTDHIDLTEFLPEDSLNSGSSASDFIDLSEDEDGNTVLSIHTGGDGADVDQEIKIEGVSMDEIYGADTTGISEADILQKTLEDQNLLNGGM